MNQIEKLRTKKKITPNRKLKIKISLFHQTKSIENSDTKMIPKNAPRFKLPIAYVLISIFRAILAIHSSLEKITAKLNENNPNNPIRFHKLAPIPSLIASL